MGDDLMPTLQATAANAARQFERRHGRPPRCIVAAPGRVNLIGEHVDYNDGFVLPMAIDRYCVIAADVARTNCMTLSSSQSGDESRIELHEPLTPLPTGHWSNYARGVVAGFVARGVKLPALDACIETRVPVGGGLSSSASLEVAMATLLEAMSGATLSASEKALLCQKAEHDFAGVPCGIMDQFASVMGRADHLMLIDCRSQSVQHIPLLDPAITVLILNTNVKHELSGGEYAHRRRQCESAARKLGVASLRDARFPQLRVRRRALEDVEFRRARHVVAEIARAAKAADAVKACDWPEVGRLMCASHDSLRDDYQVSCRELDLLVDFAREIGPDGGVIGSRMTGGGFGGCTVSLVQTAKVDDIARQLAARYQNATLIEPSTLVSRAARGAHVVYHHGEHHH